MDRAEMSIRNAATACSNLFKQCIETSGLAVLDHELAEELWGRFNLWAAYVGAFAAPKASLDARLVGHEDITDMILELLEMVQNNLRYGKHHPPHLVCVQSGVFDTSVEIETKHSANDLHTQSAYETPEGATLLLGLKAVEEAIKRLHSLGIAIRRSAAKGRQHRNFFDLPEQAESRCYRDFVRHKFPHANERLVNQLGQSMHFRGRSMFYQQRHNKKIAENREHTRPALPPKENLTEHSAELVGLEPVTTSSLTPQENLHVPMSETNYSDIDKQDFINRVSKPKPSYSHISRGSSIQESQNEVFDYPNPPNAKNGHRDASCPICCEPLDSRSLTKKMWRAHIDRDIEPYLCISEECKEPPRFFVRFRDWEEHMQREHTLEWARKVHTVTWYCEMGHSGEDVEHFDNKGDFIQHLSTAHAEALSRPQILAQARRNRALDVRDPFTCPLCDCCPEEVAPHLAEKPYGLLSAHIGRHLKALAFLSLSYVDYDEDISSSSDTTTKTDWRVGGGESNGTRLNTHDDSFDHIPLTVVERLQVRVDDLISAKIPELEDPVIWPSEIFRVYSKHDETLERFTAALTSSTVTSRKYAIGWICARSVEYIAARVFLDEEHEAPSYLRSSDHNHYTLGKIGQHNVVIAALPDKGYGISSAARVARDMLSSFPDVLFILTVGIGGGAPSSKHDIRLGDIVVSTPRHGTGGVSQCDLFWEGDNPRMSLSKQLPTFLRVAVQALADKYERNGHRLNLAIERAFEKIPRLRKKCSRPDQRSDRLYKSCVIHPANSVASCEAVCGDGPLDLVLRSERNSSDDNPVIHYGLIASANRPLGDTSLRDGLAANDGILCFEMEAPGLMHTFPSLYIRGICDYADSHTNTEWQNYAAMVAAAYARDLLYVIDAGEKKAETKIHNRLSGNSGPEQLQSQKDLASEKEKQECHRLFDLGFEGRDVNYEWYKSRIEDRLEGTCTWFLQHGQFQKWLKEPAPLLVSASPGYGKSVLAKYLIDYGLPRSATICYFFFDEQAQDTVLQMLCALLHQLFSQKPFLIKHALPRFRKDKKGLNKSTVSLWEVLEDAINDPETGPVVIVLDALDECATSDWEDLMRRIGHQHNNHQSGYGKLKYLLTSRPEMHIMYGLHSLSTSCLTIQIPIEETLEAIKHDVGRLITHRLDQLTEMKGLSPITKRHLDKRLHEADYSSLLWVILVFKLLEKEDFEKTKQGVDKSIIINLPNSLHDAYKQAFIRSQGYSKAQKALSIILAASRPLKISEINIAVNTDYIPKSIYDLNLEDDDDFILRLRSFCGSFVSIHHGKVYLSHHAARQFLLAGRESTTNRGWHHSITARSSHAVLAAACVLYLDLYNYDDGGLPTEASLDAGDPVDGHVFFDYAAEAWGAHFREADFADNAAIIAPTLRICEPSSRSYSLWFRKHWKTIGKDMPQNFTDLMVASYFGYHTVTKLLLQKGANIEAKDNSGRTSLLWAAMNGHGAVVTLLLEKGADIEAKDSSGWAPLLLAAMKGHDVVTRLLLEKGADVETKDHFDRTPLLWAVMNSHKAIIELLLMVGANTEAKDYLGRTLLSWATMNGQEAVTRLLLEKGANIEAKDHLGRTPLSWATMNGQEAVTRLLLEKGADVETKDHLGRTPLSYAVENGHKAVIELLIIMGANTDAKDQSGQTPLSLAAESGGNEAALSLLRLSPR